ncbi:unnamed protein product, partial [Adineta ricciae]
ISVNLLSQESLNIEKRYQRTYRLYRRSANYRYENFVTTDES